MNTRTRALFVFGLFLFSNMQNKALSVDYSVLSVNEESGIDFTQITTENDFVAMPQVRRSSNKVNWVTNRVIDISVDGTRLAYISARNNTTNIFIKDVYKQGSSIQRTNRQAVLDFSYSPDGNYICFTEKVVISNKYIRQVPLLVMSVGKSQATMLTIHPCIPMT